MLYSVMGSTVHVCTVLIILEEFSPAKVNARKEMFDADGSGI